MKNLLYAASILLLTGVAAAQSGTINSMSGATVQNQMLTGATGRSFPPEPVLNGGEPSAEDRVSGTPANATTMHLESESMTAGEISPSAAGAGKLAQEAIFESANQNPAGAAKRRQH
jgi:hypothetical protein